MHPVKPPFAVLFALIATATSTCAQELRLVLPVGHTNAIHFAMFSPDGKTIVTASKDNTAKIWNANTGLELQSLEGHSDWVYSAIFSPDGKTIVTASGDNTAKIWDAESGHQLQSLQGHSLSVHSAQFSPDGKTIVTTCGDGTVKIWDAESGFELQSLDGHSWGVVPSAQFSPDGKTIVTAASDGNAKIWDAKSGFELHSLEGHSSSVNSALFSPDGKTIVTASSDSTAKIWDAESGFELHSLEGHSSSVNSAQFSPDGRTVVTASDDYSAKIWDTESGRELQSLTGHSWGVYSAQFRLDGKTIVTTSGDGTLKIWDAESGRELHSLDGKFSAAPFSPEGNTIVTVSSDITISSDNTAKIWDANSGRELQSLEGHSDRVRSAQFSPDGKTIVTVSLKDHTAKIWDAVSGRELQSLEGHSNWVRFAEFSPDGETIVTAASDGTAKIWDTESGRELQSLEGHSWGVNSVQFSPDGKTIVTASSDYTTKIWDTESGRELQSLEGHTYKVYSAQFSPNGKTIVTASGDNTIKIWDAKTGRELQSLEGHTDWVRFAQFSPNGETIVTASNDYTAKIWDAESGRELQSLEGHSNWVNSALFSPDGKTIATASDDNTTKIWDAESGRELHSLEGHSNGVNSALFSPDGKTIATASDDNTTKIWDAETGTLLYTRLMLRDGGWLAWDPQYRFDGSSNAIDLLHFACGLEIIELSQAKDALYVPDLVQLIMSGADLSAEKTLDELDLCERTPVVTPLEGDGRGWLFDIEPRRGGLGACDVLVNGVRRFSLKVGEMSRLENGHYQVAVTLEQVASFATDEQVEVRVVARTTDGNLTSRGGSKWQSVADVMPERGPEPPSFHGLFVGINDYKGEGLNLKYAAADARDLSAVVEAAANKLFSPENVHVTTLLSDRAAGAIYDKPQRHRLLQAIADIAEQSGPRDVLMIHLAGHGNINEEGQFVFLTAEASSLQEGDYTGVTMKDINDALMEVPASNRILILDACHSGGAINNVLGEAVAFAGARDDQQLREEIARDRQISRLGDDASLAMLSASASDQAAFELQEVGHGLLTYALLEAIDGSLDILVDGEFLAIENWLMRAKQTVNEKQSEVNADGPVRQRAQWLPPTSNYAIGKVDDEVRGLISIDERPVIGRIAFEDENEDFATEFEKKLGELLDASSARGGILFQEKHPKGIILKGTAIARESGTYDVSFTLKRKGEILGQGEGTDLTIEEVIARIQGQLSH